MSVDNLGPALSQLDAVIRGVDASLLSARNVDSVLRFDPQGMQSAADAVESALGAAMPDGIRTALETLPTSGPRILFPELVAARAALARLGAAAHGVSTLGGPEAVALRGGLAAIDGASTIMRQRMHDDANGLLRAAGAHVEWGPSRFASEADRNEHVARIRAAIAAPDALMTDTHGVGSTLDSQLQIMASDRDYYRRYLKRFDEKVQEQLAWQQVGDGHPTGYFARNLTSIEAAVVAMRAFLPQRPGGVALAQLPATEVVVAAAPTLRHHVAVLDGVLGLVGDSKYHDASYHRALTGSDPFLADAQTDLAALRTALAGGTDELRATLASAEAAVSALRAYIAADFRRIPRDVEALLPQARATLDAAAASMQASIDSPRLLQIGADTADEVVEVLERRGPMDVAALQQVIDDAGAPLAAREALVAHVGRLHALTDAAPATSVPQARQLLVEALLVGDSVMAAAQRTEAEPQLLLNDASLAGAVHEVRARVAASLGAADQVPELHARQLRSNLDSLANRMTATPQSSSWEQPEPHALGALLTSVRSYDAELAARTQRAVLDGGLRAVAPSERPNQAFPAQVNWLLRELDQLPPVGADAPAEQHVDAAARRLSTLADLVEVSNLTHHGVDDATRQRFAAAVTGRLRSELASQDNLWRFPDDVARSLVDTARRLEPGSADMLRKADVSGGLGLGRDLRDDAASLRAWSMLQDGALPSEAIDRIAVGDRRAASLVAAARTVPGRQHDASTPNLHRWLYDVDVRLADLDATLGPHMPTAERAAVTDAVAPVRTHADELWEQLRAGEDTTTNVAIVDPARERMATLAAAIAESHAQLRANQAGEVAW